MPAGKLYCICRQASKGFMIQCDDCNEWFHGVCVNVTRGKHLETLWRCPFCARCDTLRQHILLEIEGQKSEVDAKLLEIKREIDSMKVEFVSSKELNNRIEKMKEVDEAQKKTMELTSEKEYYRVQLEKALEEVKDLASEKEDCKSQLQKALAELAKLRAKSTPSHEVSNQKYDKLQNLIGPINQQQFSTQPSKKYEGKRSRLSLQNITKKTHPSGKSGQEKQLLEFMVSDDEEKAHFKSLS